MTGQNNTQHVAAANAPDITKNALVGSWNVSSAGTNCQMFLTLTKYGSVSRGGTRGCVGDLTKLRGWDVVGKQVVLYDDTGNTVASLYSSGNSQFSGQTANGIPVALSR